MTGKKAIEDSLEFTPKFNNDGLIPVIAQDAETGEILMAAYMNGDALKQTFKTGNAVYYSRSRKKLWMKGEQSGHFQKVEKILTDCDQDCLVLKVRVKHGQCHVGYHSCFYRAVKKGSPDRLEFTAEKTYDPQQVYDRKR